jgi:sorting nexin-13
MSSSRYTLRDLAEEAKKRVVVLLICLFGLSYLMSREPSLLSFFQFSINLVAEATCLSLIDRFIVKKHWFERKVMNWIIYFSVQ